MINLCVVTHKLKKGDGQGRVNYEIVRAACERGYRVTILASECASEVTNEFGANFIKIQVDPWKTNLLRNQIFAWKSYLWLKQHGANFDLVNVNGFITWYPGQVNSVHFVHGAWLRSIYNEARLLGGINSTYQKIFSYVNAKLELNAFKKSEVIVAVSPLVVEELCSIGVPRQKICMIPNGVDVNEFHPGPGLRAELGISEKTPLAIFSGDLRSRRKNLETVFSALAQRKLWHLLVLSRVEGSIYPAMAREMGIAERVHFLGFRSDSPALMRTADVLVFPSRYDPCTLVVAEALSSGIPVITAQSVGAAFQVTQDCGWVIDSPENASAIAQILGTIERREPAERLEVANSARSRAMEYAWDKTAIEYLALFESMVDEKVEALSKTLATPFD